MPRVMAKKELCIIKNLKKTFRKVACTEQNLRHLDRYLKNNNLKMPCFANKLELLTTT